VGDGEGVGGVAGLLCTGLVLWLLGLGALEEGVDGSTLHRYRTNGFGSPNALSPSAHDNLSGNLDAGPADAPDFGLWRHGQWRASLGYYYETRLTKYASYAGARLTGRNGLVSGIDLMLVV
jgi:hypothetical protein